MSHETTIAKTPKPVWVLLTLAFLAAVAATLMGFLQFNHEEDTVALAAVQKLTTEPVRIDYADENHNFYVTDGETIWRVKMTNSDGQWNVQNIEKAGTLQ
jgi:hypothetical protein